MPNVPLTSALRTEYERLFETCVIRPEKAGAIDAIVGQLESNRSRYESVGDALQIPWGFIAVVHNMESSQSFSKHLHNGDPLTARTKQVPKDRPKTGNPPFTWEQSARDALTMKGLGAATDWTLAGTLYQLERYNGWGYRLYHPHVLSPYLWSFSKHYVSGKYVADGTWSNTAVSKQCGAAAILRRMAEKNLLGFGDQPLPQAGSGPLVIRYSMAKYQDATDLQRALDLQAWLNTYPGIFVKADGAPGQKTSDAFLAVTGHYLPGDPRL